MTDAGDAFDPPESNTARSASVPIGVVMGVVFCTALGFIGILNTCYSGIAIVGTQLAGGSMMQTAEQARMLDEMQAAQGWWVVPAAMLQLGLKMVLSAGLAVGGVLTLGQQRRGPSILAPVLVFGIFFEMTVAVWGLANTAWNWQKMSAQFGGTMAADPNVPAEMAETAGTAFGVLMVVGMLFTLGWAMVKSLIYGLTHRSLSSETGQTYIESWGD